MQSFHVGMSMCNMDMYNYFVYIMIIEIILGQWWPFRLFIRYREMHMMQS